MGNTNNNTSSPTTNAHTSAFFNTEHLYSPPNGSNGRLIKRTYISGPRTTTITSPTHRIRSRITKTTVSNNCLNSNHKRSFETPYFNDEGDICYGFNSPLSPLSKESKRRFYWSPSP